MVPVQYQNPLSQKETIIIIFTAAVLYDQRAHFYTKRCAFLNGTLGNTRLLYVALSTIFLSLSR